MENLEELREKIKECIQLLSTAERSLDKAKNVIKNARDNGVRMFLEGLPDGRVEKTKALFTEVEEAYKVADEPLLIAKTKWANC